MKMMITPGNERQKEINKYEPLISMLNQDSSCILKTVKMLLADQLAPQTCIPLLEYAVTCL